MKILALDLATKTGWAVGDSAGLPRFGTKILPSTGDDVGGFALAFDEWARALIAIEVPDLVVFEAPIIMQGKTSFHTARKLMGLAWHVEFLCSDLRIQCREAHIGKVKAFFAGSGRADKDAMMRIARRYGWDVKDDNAADALAVWAFSAHQRDPDNNKRFSMGSMGARVT